MLPLRNLALVVPAMIVLVLVGLGLAQEKTEPKQEPKPELVVIDLNKLSPEVAKRLIEEIAKQKETVAADTTEKKTKGKGGEAPSKGKKSPRTGESDREPAKKREKSKEPGRPPEKEREDK